MAMKKTKKYLLITGFLFLFLIIIIMVAKGTFNDYVNCQNNKQAIINNAPPEVSNNGELPSWWINNYCSGINNNIYLSLIIITIAIGLITTGFIMR